MTIFYRTTAVADPYNLGYANKMSAALQAGFNGSKAVYNLGYDASKGYIYTDTTTEELAPVTLDTLAQMADRIDYLTQPKVTMYDYKAKLQHVSAALRAFTVPTAALGADPLPATPLPAVSGSLSAVPGFEKPRNGMAYSGGEFATPGYVGNNANWDPFIAAGARAMRLPIRYSQFSPGGKIDTLQCNGSLLSGPAVDAWHSSQAGGWATYLIGKGCMVVFDDHSYRDMANNDIMHFWKQFDDAMKASAAKVYGSPLLVYELQNEPSCNPATYGDAMFRTVHGLRAAGVTATLAVGWGFYNKYSTFTQYMDAIEAAGGVENLDPLNRLVFVFHDYWEPSGNDQSGKVSGNIVIADRYADMLATARKYGVTLVAGEIGLGGGNPGWLPSDGTGAKKDGQALFNEYVAWAEANSDVVKGTWAWGGGRTSGTYAYNINLASNPGKALAAFWSSAAV